MTLDNSRIPLTGSGSAPLSSQASGHVPTQLDVNDLLLQPGRDHIPKLSEVDGIWFGYTCGISQQISRIYKSTMDDAWPTYGDIPQTKRDSFFRSFAQEFN